MTTPNPKKPAAKKAATPKETAMPEPIVTPEPTVEPTTVEAPAEPKKKLSYAEKLDLLPPEEAAIIRAKANEASKRSRAKKLGVNPGDLKLQRLEKAVEKARAKLTAATDEFDAALLALNTAKQETEQTNDEAK